MRELAARLWSELWEDEVTDRAAALSYYFLFALFPALLFLVALLGLLPLPHLLDQFMGYVARVLPGDAASIIRKTLAEIVSGAGGGLLSVGVLAALWAGSNGMTSVITALNIVYDVEEWRPWWKRRLLAIALTIGFALFILSALLLMVFGPRIGSALAGGLGLGSVFTAVWSVLSVPVALVFVLIGIELVYYFAPAIEQRWRWVTPGTAVALLLWLVMSLALRMYVNYVGNYNATYGSIGGVILLMLWLYLTGVVLLLGAEVNSEIDRAAGRRDSEAEPAEPRRAASASGRHAR